MSVLQSAEHDAVRSAVREFAENEIRPRSRDHDEIGTVSFPWDVFETAADLDFMAPHFPEKYGGMGTDLLTTLLVHEEFNRADPGIGTAVLAARFGAELVLEFGTDEQKDRYVTPVMNGEMVSGAAISEPNAGSDVAAIRTTAETDGDDYVINGTKTWASNAPIAEYMVVATKTSPDERHRGISTILVPTDADGFTVENEIEKMGMRASPTAELSLSDVRVPRENLIGAEDRGFYQVMNLFNHNRLFTASDALGAAVGAFESALDYASEREAFGRTIDGFQGMQWKLADMKTKIETARSLIYRTAHSGDEENFQQLAAISKYYATDICEEVCSEAIQVHGGYGYTREFLPEKFYRDTRVMKIWEGTSEIQKNVIFESLSE